MISDLEIFDRINRKLKDLTDQRNLILIIGIRNKSANSSIDLYIIYQHKKEYLY